MRPVPVSGAPDHPRSRGEYPATERDVAADWGSSPVSRGIPLTRNPKSCYGRIIPALAGNTEAPHPFDPHSTDHPRSRGEYSIDVLPDYVLRGSSPLSRRIQDAGDPGGQEVRIIPALAGNTPGTVSTTMWSRDHPRSRGEYAAATIPAAFATGSSPLSRGIRWRIWMRAAKVGIIPALAGNTWFPKVWTSVPTDHPRSRGEY